jgi:hypothetical protein
MRWIFFISIILLGNLSAQSPITPQWVQNLGSGSYDHVSGIVWDGDAHVYIAGYFSGTIAGQSSNGSSDGFVAKYHSDGTLLWLRSFGGLGDDRVHQISFDSSARRVLITGYFSGKMYFGSDSLQATQEEDLLLLAIDENGNWQWGRGFGTSGIQSGTTVAVDKAHRICLSGYFEDTLQADAVQLVCRGLRNAFLLQLDSIGHCNWGYRMGGLLYDEGLNIVFDAEDNVYLSGYYRDTADFGPFAVRSVFTYDCFLVSLGAAGNWRWLRSFGGGYVDNCPALTYMPKSGNILVGGWFFNDISFGDTTLFSAGEEESYFAVFDTTGQLQWAKRFGHTFAELLFDFSVDADDNIVAVGTFDSIIFFGTDTFRAKHYNRPTDLFLFGFSPDGNYRWGYRAGAEFNDFGFHVAWGDSSMVFASGNFLNKTIFSSDTIFSNGNYDIYLAKLFLDTALIGTAISQVPMELPPALVPYPNPNNGVFYIDLPANCSNRHLLRIYDASGRLLQSAHYEENNKKEVNVSTLAPGLYYVELHNACGRLIAPLIKL